MRICCVMWLTWSGIVFCLRLSFGEDSHAPLFQTRCRDIANGAFRDLRRSWYVLVSDFFSTSRVVFLRKPNVYFAGIELCTAFLDMSCFPNESRVALLHIQWQCSKHLFKHCTLWFLDVLKGLQSTLSWHAQIWAWICAFHTCNRLYKRLYDKDPGKEAGISTFQGGGSGGLMAGFCARHAIIDEYTRCMIYIEYIWYYYDISVLQYMLPVVLIYFR